MTAFLEEYTFCDRLCWRQRRVIKPLNLAQENSVPIVLDLVSFLKNSEHPVVYGCVYTRDRGGPAGVSTRPDTFTGLSVIREDGLRRSMLAAPGVNPGVSWITALSKTRNPTKYVTWTEVKRAVPGFTQCSYPANTAFTWITVDGRWRNCSFGTVREKSAGYVAMTMLLGNSPIMQAVPNMDGVVTSGLESC